MCIVNVCFKHYCLFDWDTHFFPLWANHCLSYFNLTFCIWLCICICAFNCICIRWKSKCSSPSRWRIEVKWKCPRQIIMLSRQSRTARAPAGFYLPLRNFDFSPQIFCPFFRGFAFFPKDTHPSKCIRQKLREQKIPIWARAFVSEFSIFQLSFSLFIFRTHIIVRFHLSRAVWNQNRSWDWAIRAKRLGCTLTACIAGISEFLQRKNFWMNSPWEKMSVSVVIHSVKCFVQVNLFSIPCFPYLPHWSPNILSWAEMSHCSKIFLLV